MMPTLKQSGGQDKAVATVRILLADDHTVVRQGLKALLRSEEDIEVIGEAENGRRALDTAMNEPGTAGPLDLTVP